MNKFLIIAIIVVVVILEMAIAPRLKFNGVFPNLLLIALVYVGLFAGRREVLTASLSGGLLLDLFSNFPFGFFIIIFILIGVLLNESKYYLFARTNFLVVLLAMFVATILFYFLTFIFAKIFVVLGLSQTEVFFKENMFFTMPKELLVNLIATAVIFFFLRITRRPLATIYGSRSNF